MSTYSKRALNKAQTRLNILNALYKLSSKQNFRELMVITIAKEAGITEKTFYNYFEKKEDILGYMTGLWSLQLLHEHIVSPLYGEAAIRRIFSHTAKQVKAHPKLMAHYVASLLTREIEPGFSDIPQEDRFLLYPKTPQIYSLNIPSGNEMLLQHLAEIDPTKEHTTTLLQLASNFYGMVLVSHTTKMDIELLYTQSLDALFNP